MAGKNDVFEYDLLRLIFNGVAITNWAATAGTTQIWAALLTADPGEAGSTANEGGYAQYTRTAVARSTAGWSVSSQASTAPASVSPVSAISFPQNTSTSTGTFSYASLYPSSAAASTQAIYSGAISPTINFSQNVTPSLTTGSAITED